MSNYIFIKGQKLQVLSADPDNPSEGQIWYNSTDETLRAKVTSPLGVWSTGANLLTKRDGHSGAGTQTAGLSLGMGPPVAGPNSNLAEEYNGTSWTAGGALNNPRSDGAGAGTQTAAFYAGGNPQPSGKGLRTEEYDGTSFTNSGDINIIRDRVAGAGTQTAGLIFTGYSNPASPRYVNSTEEYDGSSWTIASNHPYGAMNLGGTGTQTAGLSFGGSPSPVSLQYAISTSEYNGSSWTAGGTMLTDKWGASAAGTQTAALAVCGKIDGIYYLGGAGNVIVDEYDGTSWTSAGNRNTRVSESGASTGTTTAALAFGGINPGANPSILNSTEEYNVVGDNLYVQNLGGVG